MAPAMISLARAASRLATTAAARGSGLAAPLGAAPGLSARRHLQSSAEPTKTLKVGIIGAGRIGQVHAQTLAYRCPSAEPLMIVDYFPEVAKSTAAEYGIPESGSDYMDVVNHPDIQAVWVCSPSSLHAEQIIASAKAGKHIFCEKPLATELAEVDDVMKVVEDCGVKMMLAFQRRFDPNFARLRQAIVDGVVGDPFTFRLTSRDPAPPPLAYLAHSGGLFRDMMIHDFDVARWLLDDTVVSVQAIGSVLVDAEIGAAGDIDTATVMMRTARGRHCTICCSRRASYGYDQRIEVHGSQGSASATNHHLARIEVATVDGFTRPPLLDFFMSRYARAYAAGMAAFVAAVRGDAPVTTDGTDGLAALVLADAAVRSMASGRAVDPAESIEPGRPS